MRNFILHELLTDPPDPNKIYEFDKMYGESQAFIGEAVLVSDNYELTEKINQLNEDFYRTDWKQLLLTSGDLGKVNPTSKKALYLPTEIFLISYLWDYGGKKQKERQGIK